MKTFFVLAFVVLCLSRVFCQQHQIDSLLKILPATRDSTVRVDILNALAFQYIPLSLSSAEEFARQAMTDAGAIAYKRGLAESLKNMGTVHMVRGEYTMAVETGYQSLKLYEQLHDKAGRSKAMNNLALVFNERGEFDKAYDLTRQSLMLKREVGDSLGVANSLLALATYYRSTRDYNRALAACKQALARYQVLQDDHGVSYAYLQMGEVYHDQRNYPFAGTYYRDALRIARVTRDNGQTVTATKQLGQLFLDAQQYDSAYKYLHQCAALARRYSSRRNEQEATQALARYFENRGMLDSALLYTRMAGAVERAMFERQKRDQIAGIQMLYDFQKKEQELNFQKKIVRRQYVAIVGVTLVLLLAITLGFKFYGLNRTNRQAKEALLKLNTDIHAMNENLEAMVQERTEEIGRQNQRLIEYAFFTAHEVRGPLARILGLVELAKINELKDEREEIMGRLKEAAEELDEVIRTINRKLESNRRL